MPWTVGRLASFLLRLAGLKLALKTAFWWPSVLFSFGMAKPGRCELQTVSFRECRPGCIGSMYEVGPIRALPGEISLQSSMLSCCLAFQINVSLQNDGTLKSKYSGLLLYRVHTWAQPTCVHIADAICLKTFDMHRIHIGHAGWIHLFRRRWMCSTRTITLWSSLPPLLVLRFRTQNLVMLVARAEHPNWLSAYEKKLRRMSTTSPCWEAYFIATSLRCAFECTRSQWLLTRPCRIEVSLHDLALNYGRPDNSWGDRRRPRLHI